MFVNEQRPLQAKDLCSLFYENFSPQGNNRRAKENQTICHWRDWLINVEGVTLWGKKSLSENLDIRLQLLTDLKFSSSDSLSSKSRLLDVSASLKVSFLGGLVEVGRICPTEPHHITWSPGVWTEAALICEETPQNVVPIKVCLYPSSSLGFKTLSKDRCQQQVHFPTL
ncbi:hypothetical protein QQF64_000332 [Cirrhinus molitorella]|uniref:SRCR domain-containing protein n=1 Tax=Cirrhinus molitorella TaxID=172907 RepID=A0ABR3NX85_9TELE